MNTPIIILIASSVALILVLMLMLVLMRISNKQQMAYQREQIRQLRERADEFMPPHLKALDEWKMEIYMAIKLAEKDRPKRRSVERDRYDMQTINQMLHCDRYEPFFGLIDKRLDGFSTYMRNQFQLSDRELMFVCLSLLNLSDEQISLVMEYSYASIPTTRVRIGKKLGITNSSDWSSRLLELVNRA